MVIVQDSVGNYYKVDPAALAKIEPAEAQNAPAEEGPFSAAPAAPAARGGAAGYADKDVSAGLAKLGVGEASKQYKDEAPGWMQKNVEYALKTLDSGKPDAGFLQRLLGSGSAWERKLGAALQSNNRAAIEAMSSSLQRETATIEEGSAALQPPTVPLNNNPNAPALVPVSSGGSSTPGSGPGGRPIPPVESIIDDGTPKNFGFGVSIPLGGGQDPPPAAPIPLATKPQPEKAPAITDLTTGHAVNSTAPYRNADGAWEFRHKGETYTYDPGTVDGSRKPSWRTAKQAAEDAKARPEETLIKIPARASANGVIQPSFEG
jgi:hypothetical protein